MRTQLPPQQQLPTATTPKPQQMPMPLSFAQQVLVCAQPPCHAQTRRRAIKLRREALNIFFTLNLHRALSLSMGKWTRWPPYLLHGQLDADAVKNNQL